MQPVHMRPIHERRVWIAGGLIRAELLISRAGIPRSAGNLPEILIQRFLICGFLVCGLTILTIQRT